MSKSPSRTPTRKPPKTRAPGETPPRRRRGRPPKFGRPAQIIALSLPDDVLTALRTLHPDPGWAIVQLVERSLGSATEDRRCSPPAAVAELVHLPGSRALIVVQPHAFARMRGVATIALADGRAFLAFDQPSRLADLEVAILDQMEAATSVAQREDLTQAREIVRAWRKDSDLVFRPMSILVVERGAGERRPLPVFKTQHQTG